MKNAVTATVDLALLTGAALDGGAGIYPLDEKNNTQGMLDMGVCPEYLPGYHTYEHAAGAFGSAWNCAVPTAPGKNLFQIVEAIEAGRIKALYVMGSDLLHILPDRNRTVKALQKLDLLVVQDMFLTDTARLAHILLPAATGAEKGGSFTSADNRVQCFTAAVKPAGEARSDADILKRLHGMIAPSAPISTAPAADALHNEITTLTALYSEVCDHDGCRMGREKNRTGKAVFAPLSPVAPVSGARDFFLTAGPVLHHNGSMTTWSDNNMLVAGEAYVEMSGEDAADIGVSQGGLVKLSSDTGSIALKACISGRVLKGTLFVPSHFRDPHMNILTESASFPVAVSLAKA